MFLELSVFILWVLVIALIVTFIFLYSKGDFERVGPTGPIGQPGTSSSTGATGPTGLNGIGIRGPQGVQGVQGIQGFPGNVGPTGLPGGNQCLIAFNSVNNYISNTYQFYTGQSQTEASAQLLMPGAAIISGFSVNVTNAPGLNGTNLFVLRVNGMNSTVSLSIILNNLSGQSSGSVQVYPGDLISVSYTAQGTPTPTAGKISFIITLL
jgi:hypothetical protein